MIELTIRGETDQEFAKNLTTVAALLNAQLNTVAQPPAKAPRGGKTTQQPAAEAQPEADPTGDAAAAAPAETSATTTAQPAGEVTADSVRAKCVAYGQPGKGGQQALKELLIKHGSVNGKWSEIGASALPGLNAELDSLLG